MMEAFVSLPVKNPEVEKLKKRYQPHSALEPHITLIPPGRLMVEPKEAKLAFKSIKSLGEVTLKSAGIASIENRKGGVIWLSFVSNQKLLNLLQLLTETLSGTVISDENNHHQQIPHLTLGRFRTASERRSMEQGLASEILPTELALEDVVLLVKEAAHEDWQQLARLDL